jgi:hypothetical protein
VTVCVAHHVDEDPSAPRGPALLEG